MIQAGLQHTEGVFNPISTSWREHKYAAWTKLVSWHRPARDREVDAFEMS